MNSPTVSVLLPVHNGAGTIARAVESVRAQSLTDWELVVVQNGSTDGTAEVLADLARGESRIRIVNMEAPGLVPALNRGLQACRGEFIARLDADDEMRPSRLAAQVLALREHAGWGLVSCRVEFGGDARAQAGYADHVRWLNEQIQPAQLRLARFVEAPLAHPSVMWRRAISDAHGAYRDGDFPEDYELWLRWFEAGVEMSKVDAALLVWHDSPGRLSRVDSRYRPEAFFRLKAAFMARELVRTAGGRAVWIAGAGRPTRRRAAELETHGVTIAGYLDVDPRKIGQRIEGRPVVGPGELPDQAAAVVLSYVGNRGARDKIRGLLAAQGRAEGRDFWLCA